MYKLLFIFSTIFALNSCATYRKDRINIVNYKGEKRVIKNRIVPEFNKKQLQIQKSTNTNKQVEFMDSNKMEDVKEIILPLNNNDDIEVVDNNVSKYKNNFSIKEAIKDKDKEKLKIDKEQNTDIEQKTKQNSEINTKKEAPTNLGKSKKNQYYVQIGIYQNSNSANKILSKYKNISSGVIENFYSSKHNKELNKVMLGGFETEEYANKALQKVIKTGHYDSFVVKK